MAGKTKRTERYLDRNTGTWKERTITTKAEAEAAKKRAEDEGTSLGKVAKRHREARGEKSEATPTPTPKRGAKEQLKGLVKPMPKQKDYPNTKAWMAAMRKWRADQNK